MYISKALGINMDSVVNYLVLLIMLVFDPLAVALVFAANSIKKKNDFDSKEKKSILLDSTGELDAINDIADDINEINTNKIENVETILEENTPVEIQTESVVTQTQENTDLYGEPENKIKYSRMVKIR
jgi:hypothetical protein